MTDSSFERTAATTSRTRHNKWHWFIGMLSLLGSTVAIVIALRADRDVHNEIVLADENGRPRVRLRADIDGGAIELLDDRGAPRLALQQTDKGLVRISMHAPTTQDPDHPTVLLSIAGEKGVLELRHGQSGAALNGDGSVGLFSSLGRASLSADAFQGPLLNLYGDEKRSFRLVIGKDKTSISGQGPFLLANDGLVQEMAWHARHARLDPDKYPQ